MTKTATFIKSRNAQGEGRVYRLEPPMPNTSWDADENEAFEYVWVSAVHAPYSGPETYIFGCNADGEVINWGELDGSFRGDFDHERALNNAGYEVFE